MTNRQLDEEAIFHVAREIANPAARSLYLDQVCGGDPQLRERVEALLVVHEQEGVFLKSGEVPATTADTWGNKEAVGEEIGRYKLREKLGEGGFGVVWAAEQFTPVRRKVALKIIKPGMDTRDIVARFEAERQALALMDHPNIARVFDGGTTPQGRPYFVMELIRGVPITQYCDENHLTVAERLRLFVDVCKAVQHAHQKGIIHRDIKPSNVLVTLHDEAPVPKVIDFGVAKALSQQLTDKTIYTRVHAAVGTLAYMAPEQAALTNLDIDTRADVYGLGALLYELLTGTTPLDARRLERAALDEAIRMIREEEPPRASTKLSSLGATATATAAHRGTDVHSLTKTLRGDVDWIVMKALEKNRSRRYETANALADDLNRYLHGDPIAARPPSTAYRLRKAAVRHRVALTAGTIVALTLIASTMTSSCLAIRASRSLKKAQTIFLDKVLMRAVAGDVELTRESLRGAEDVGLDPMWSEFALAEAYTWKGDHDKAQMYYNRALEYDPDSYAVRAAQVQVITSDQDFYPAIRRLRAMHPSEPLDYVFVVQGEAWYSPPLALEALERCGAWRDSTLARYFGAIAHANNALLNGNLAEAEESIDSFEQLLKWYPGNQVPLCGIVYTSLTARNIAIQKRLKDRASEHERTARQAAEALTKPEHANIFWVTRSRAWCFAECGEGQLALAEWKKRMGREPLGVDPMHYAACCCLFGDEHTRREALDALPDAFSAKNAHAHLAKAYLLALSQATPDEVDKACQGLRVLNDPRREMQCGIVEAWLARGDMEKARHAAEELPALDPDEPDEYWDLFLDYVVNDGDDEAFIKEFSARNPPMFQVNAAYLVGLTAYAQGRTEVAKTYFRQCVDTGRVFASWYWWSKVFLQRLEDSPGTNHESSHASDQSFR